MEKSRIINDGLRETAAQFPIYSQDNKRGDAVAWLKLIITGTPATYYILEAAQAHQRDTNGTPTGTPEAVRINNN